MELFRIGLLPVTWRDLVDLVLLGALLYAVLRWLYRLNLLGVALLLLSMTIFLKLASLVELVALAFFLRQVMALLAIFLGIALGPELRRFLLNFRLFPGVALFRKTVLSQQEAEKLAQELVEALQLLSKNGLGALIALEGNTDLTPFAQSGDALQMPLEARMLLMIFEKKSPLHDGAVIVRGDKIIAARCTLPLSERLDLPQSYGQRHRAAIGLSEHTDALVLVVSEETGLISFARHGEIKRLPLVELKKLLVQFYLA
ncbi:MAG: hypothetical protein KatS3mg026_0772 [Bacteroidia bacterium]|nr:MAG: hypothetical protein KatS3mg026_0772 [Bacteroidia bacterium]